MDRKQYFYSYTEGSTGDFMPFYHDGRFHIFYIAWKDWGHASTKDFVHFEEHGIAIEHGTAEEPDHSVFTGSIIEKEGVFHAFYCGYNEFYEGQGKPPQTMLHATSTDLYQWKKDKDFALPVDTNLYMPHAWRDGYVLYDEKNQLYRMLITAAAKEKTHKRWGSVALAVSKDLIDWEVCPPCYAPSQFDSLECPEIFSMGGKWYMIFSTYTRWWETHYRAADSIDGPWKTPKQDDLFDGRAFYAAKTVSDGTRRFIVGWTAARKEMKDSNAYDWGGHLTAHELVQRPDGTLAVKMIPEIEESVQTKCPIAAGELIGRGTVESDNGIIRLRSEEAFCSIPVAETGHKALIKATIRIAPETVAAGIVFRASYPVFDKWCALRIEPGRQRIFFDRCSKFFDDQFYDEMRPLRPAEDGVYEVKIFTYGTICVMYINDELALSVRNYEYTEGQVGLLTEEGSAEFTNIEVMV